MIPNRRFFFNLIQALKTTEDSQSMSDGLYIPTNKTQKSPFMFSRVWEDHKLVSTALDIQPEEDMVLCITRYSYMT